LGPSDFVHLHVHSDYSLLDGAAKLDDLVKKAKTCGQTALALTDHGTLSGIVSFYKECKKNEIKSILGCEVYIAPGLGENAHKDRVKGYNHLTLLAKNDAGWKNLSRLTSIASLEGFYYRPRMSWDLISKHKEGLIALSGCLKGPISVPLTEGRPTEARAEAARWKELFQDDFYLEIQPNSLDEQKVVNSGCLSLSKELGIKTVATCDLHYVEPHDAEAQEIRICISSGKTLKDESRLKMKEDFYFRSSEDMQKNFSHVPEAILATREIADKVGSIKLLPGTYFLPKFHPPDGSDARTYFRRISREGLDRRYGPEAVKHTERLEYELGVIEKLGFVDYFLIVQDFINWAKKNGCPVGPGRGSAAGSIVAYCQGITDIDPIRYDLLFERFLNPERVSMPDIDVDFCETNRGKVIEYVRKKYGNDNVCQIITFGTLKAKAVIRDVGRVLDVPLPEVDKIAKLVPEGPKTTLEDALKETPDLAKLRDEPQYQRLFDLALKLEGVNRHAGKHAAGIVISDVNLLERIPLCRVGEDTTTQFTMTEVEEVGLLKMDFLGLRTLTLIEDCLKLVSKTTGTEVDQDRIPLECKKTFELLQKGDTRGVFQLESSGFRKLLIDSKPDRFEDIIALLALYRPGPLGSGMDQLFINRKHGREPIVLEHPSLEPILRDTYGCFLYQEQVMILANKVAGFSLAEADTLRKAMGKKKVDLMEKYRAKFVEGCGKNGVDEKKATTIWDQIVKFAEYGFNKCVVGETLVVDADTGERVTVARLHREGLRPRTLSVDPETREVVRRAVLDVVENGVKPVFELRTRGARRIVATGNHPFLTPRGWVNLEDLRPGDEVAAFEAVEDDLVSSRTTRRAANARAASGRWFRPEPSLLVMAGALLEEADHDGEVVWDRVFTIEPRGDRMTYDLEIDDTHNFVANGLVVHNSHSAAYGLVTYRTAWLKANYPVEFMAATLTSWSGDTDKLVEYVEELNRMGLELVPPDVNSGIATFDVVPGKKKILYGLEAIKGMGSAAVAHILEARGRLGGRFRSIFQFCEEVDSHVVNKATLEALVKAGAFASTGAKRSQLAAVLEQAVQMGVQEQKDRQSKQVSLFGVGTAEQAKTLDEKLLPEIAEWKDADLLAREKEALGFYLTSHPLEEHRPTIERFATARTSELAETAEGSDVTVGGVIVGLRTMLDKRGNTMAFVTLEDFTGTVDGVIFGSVWPEVRDFVKTDAGVFLQGKLDKRREAPSVKVDAVIPLAQAEGRLRVSVSIDMVIEETTEAMIMAMNELFSKYRGDDVVYYTFRRRSDNALAGPFKIGSHMKVRGGDALRKDLLGLLGPSTQVRIGASAPQGDKTQGSPALARA
jgi:DNA polymerase-3 subunit alpha